jgi:decaprenylphospho-beta-D-erythro-pentofuranosid-2-ulose 2-reductase
MRDAFGIPQTVVVLGATSDIAGAITTRLVRRGCRRAVLAGRDPSGLDEAAQRVAKQGAVTTHLVHFDATVPADAARTVEQCFSAAGDDVDLVLIAVGALGDQQADERDGARTAATIAATYAWPAAAATEAVGRLTEQGHGRLVVLSSVAGVRVRQANFIYGAAKRGLDAHVLGLAEAVRGSGVVVQVVRPGFVRTRMTVGLTPAPLATKPERVAEAVVAALGGSKPVVWVPGALRWVFAVLSVLPGPIWRRLPG